MGRNLSDADTEDSDWIQESDIGEPVIEKPQPRDKHVRFLPKQIMRPGVTHVCVALMVSYVTGSDLADTVYAETDADANLDVGHDQRQS
jgi:hypothetical protein